MRRLLRKRDSRSLCHRILRDLCFGRLQRPGAVMYFAAIHRLPRVDRVEAIALAEEMIDSAGCRRFNSSSGVIGGTERRRRRTGMSAIAPIFDRFVSDGFHAHVRTEIRQMKQCARALDSECAPGIETEKVDTGFPTNV